MKRYFSLVSSAALGASFTVALAAVVAPAAVLADACTSGGGVDVSAALGAPGNCVGLGGVNPIFSLLDIIIKFATGAFGIVLVLMIVIAGLEYVIAGGNSDKVKGAKNRLVQAATGFVLFLLMYGVLQVLLPNGVNN